MKAATKTINVAINGSAGNIAYSLIPLLCNGLVFGQNTKISLRLLELPSQQHKLEGTVMEIEDGAYPLLEDVQMFFNNKEGLKNADVFISVASHPHYPGMERNHLLKKNVEIYREIGESLNSFASKDCKVVVVGNPVNSLTTVLSRFAPNIPDKNFTGLSRLDHNRAKYLLAKTCGVTMDQIKDLVVWGNHSDTQYPDVSQAKIGDQLITDILKAGKDRKGSDWLHGEYVDYCVNRWKKIVEARGITR